MSRYATSDSITIVPLWKPLEKCIWMHVSPLPKEHSGSCVGCRNRQRREPVGGSPLRPIVNHRIAPLIMFYEDLYLYRSELGRAHLDDEAARCWCVHISRAWFIRGIRESSASRASRARASRCASCCCPHQDRRDSLVKSRPRDVTSCPRDAYTDLSSGES